ncbi:MAG: SPOR domain-containing protein [Prevotella sp.]|nr:SPOR domain-containing protein [Prevotella sp.]
MKRFIFSFTFLVCALQCGAQTFTDALQTPVSGGGKVTIVEADDITALINGHINEQKEPKSAAEKPAPKPAATPAAPSAGQKPASNESGADEAANVDTSKKVIKNPQKITGYRVQVFSGGNSRDDKTKAETTGEQIKRLFPDQPVYVHFYSPRWICRMGNYRTYEEAQEMLTRVRDAGYKQASLVKGTITPTD